MKFEVKYRDAAGRIGVLKIKNKKIETPVLFPVVHPREGAESIKRYSQVVITNSYLIYKNEELREKAIKQGIHKLLNFDGVVFTDSGSYQLYEYGDVEISNREILEFQNRIGVDIGVILDVPTEPNASYDKALRDVETTIERALEAKNIKKNFACIATVQGARHLRLRAYSARKLGELNFEFYAIGGVVPLMENYEFSTLVKIILQSKKYLPIEKPVHLFGAGHPMLFPLAVSLGIDTFDSAAYILYAKEDRYITPYGTLKLSDIKEFPCLCEVCLSYKPSEVRSMDKKERTNILAKHNLLVSIQEINRVKQAIYENKLLELVESRARAHPSLLEALRIFYNSNYLRKLDPITKKSAFFYSGEESLRRPEVKEHLRRIKNIESSERLVVLADRGKPFYDFYKVGSSKKCRFVIASGVFGIIPIEVEEVYPLNQHEAPRILDKAQRKFMEIAVKNYSKLYKEVLIDDALNIKLEGAEYIDYTDIEKDFDMGFKLRAIADYIYGSGAGKILFKKPRAVFSRTGRIRYAYDGDVLIGTIRASDGFLTLSIEGAKRLIKAERNVVFVGERAKETIKNRSVVYNRDVLSCSSEIKPYHEVIVADEEKNLLGVGKTILSSLEMLKFKHGIAVKIRHKNKEYLERNLIF